MPRTHETTLLNVSREGDEHIFTHSSLHKSPWTLASNLNIPPGAPSEGGLAACKNTMADVDQQIRMIASFVELEATEKAAEIRAR